MTIRHFRELIAWQKAMSLVREVYKTSQQFPKEELYGPTSQMRRAVVSVPSNIAEGQGRDSSKEFVHHLSIAYGSLMDVETHLLIAEMLGYVEIKEVEGLLDKSAEVGRIINGLSRSIANK